MRWTVVVGALLVAGACAGSSGGPSISSTTAGSTLAVPTIPEGGPPTTAFLPDTGDGVGDPLFPALGNPGLDVQSYDLVLEYDPGGSALAGRVVITFQSMADLDTMTLDAVGLQVTSVLLDGGEVDTRIEPEELRIVPADAIRALEPHRVEVAWTTAVDATSSGGWVPTRTGAIAPGAPDRTRTWMPANDHPSDLATWTIHLRVPDGMFAGANGILRSLQPVQGGQVWTWESAEPMATSQVQVVIGALVEVDGTTTDGVSLSSFLPADDPDRWQPVLDLAADQLRYFSAEFGPYPLGRFGLAIVDAAPGVAMAHFERPLLSSSDLRGGVPDLSTHRATAHRVAQQWFGSAVGIATWSDLWLSDGFATYAEWMWLDDAGLVPLDQSADEALGRRHALGETARPVAEPSVADLGDVTTQDGGAMVLHALRRFVGDETFTRIMRTWVVDHQGRPASTEDFAVHAEAVAGVSLVDLFDSWLYAAEVPAAYPSP